MRDIVFLVAFVSSIPLIFVSPFNGVIVWYAFSLGNFHTLTWGSFGGFYYGYIIAISTVVSWMISREKKSLPLTPLSVMTLIFMVWITMTTVAASPAATSPGQTLSSQAPSSQEAENVPLGLLRTPAAPVASLPQRVQNVFSGGAAR